jgi:hypothetical protein
MFALALVFCFGVLNFAAHAAVLESGHPILLQVPAFLRPLGGRLSLLVEFVMLTGAMLMTAAGSLGWAWLYALYTALNAAAAWLVFSDRS